VNGFKTDSFHKKYKIMIFNGQEIEFPAITKISFFKVIEMLEQQVKDPDTNVSKFATDLLAECRKYPELIDGLDGREELGKYKPVVDRLSRVLFPDALLTNEIKGLLPPFEFEPFYLSTRFQKILENAGEGFTFEMKGYNPDLIYIYGASSILSSYYNYWMSSGVPTSIEISDQQTNIIRSYRLAFNADLIEMVPTDKAPKITEEDYKELMADFYNIDLWKKKFPPNSYIMRGIGVANLMDVTPDRSMSAITSSLLNKSPQAFQTILQSFRNLLGIGDLEGGFIEHENGVLTVEHMREKGMSSLLLQDEDEMQTDVNLGPIEQQYLFEKRAPMVITDVEKFEKISNSPFAAKLAKCKNIGSYILAPIATDDEVLGFLELASPRKYELNGAAINHLEKIIPIFSMAISRFKRESQNLREVIIQQECTTIHPSVKWRFDEEADKYIKAEFAGQQPIFSDIVFNEVYPLYGQLDIKGSSEKRNEAITDDLLKQIKGLKKVLAGALKERNLPVYEQLIFRLDRFRDDLKDGISSGGEQKIQSFIGHEIKPVLDQLSAQGGKMAQLVKQYLALIDPELGTVYEKRRKFDTSVNVINQSLASMLDEKQVEAQKMFPHYFERYKTDGVEYNMYIGQAISGQEKFDTVYLDNLRLWQLMTMCELENRYDELRKELDTNLEIASLILVYSSPLSVHFRMDEKRFDVEGAYNARYEIVKKRVDKAHIKGTNERITAPGKLAIIYTSEQDAVDYQRYVQFLESKGMVKKNTLEYLDIEDLQGLSGLKALRVEVNYGSADDSQVSIDELLEKIR